MLGEKPEIKGKTKKPEGGKDLDLTMVKGR